MSHNSTEAPKIQQVKDISAQQSGEMVNGDRRTVAFIDGSNLHKSIQRLGWELSLASFRNFLQERYNVGVALLFLGHIPQYREMYEDFRCWGYTPVFKRAFRNRQGRLKGNCDTELAVHAIAGCCENDFDNAVLVSGDGDFTCVASFLQGRQKLKAVVAPAKNSCSRSLSCLKQVEVVFVEAFRAQLELRETAIDLSSVAWWTQ